MPIFFGISPPPYRAGIVPQKKWDLIIVSNQQLVAVLEFKSQIGSLGNNFNNRVEESLGSATDLWAAFEKGAFQPSYGLGLGISCILKTHLRP